MEWMKDVMTVKDVPKRSRRRRLRKEKVRIGVGYSLEADTDEASMRWCPCAQSPAGV